MKILIISIRAQKGSIGAILSLLINGLKKDGHEIRLCYGYYDENPKGDEYIRICSKNEFRLSALMSRLTGKEGYYAPIPTSNIISEIQSFKPDVVHLTNLHAYYMNEYEVLNYLKQKNIPTVYSMFDAYSFTGKCPFPFDCDKYFTGCGNCPQVHEYPKSWIFDRSSFLYKSKQEVYTNFRNLHFVGGIGIYNQAKDAPLLKSNEIHLINEPQDLDDFFFPRDTSDLKKELGIPMENKVILAAVPLSDNPYRKRGYYFLELFDKMKDTPGYTFVYIGFRVTKFGDPQGMIKIPFVDSPSEYAKYLSLGDVLFFTSVADTTSLTVIDALACGTPIVGFDIEGMKCFNIADERVMKLVPIGDTDEIEKFLRIIPKKDTSTIMACRDSVYTRFNDKFVVRKYIELYNKIIRL